jgi:alkanesulfonate monooxygenase SsuD/methylene tetrahydromethanopterin reductase-like flavin-dependent oxidoreductase (luciferase family)
MHFGVFDHLDASGLAVSELYEQRLQLIAHYEKVGIRSYHLAEHHATPLGMAPSPSVFLSSVAQRTRSLLFGPMVFTVALYHPLRLAEEICMLDQLSRGRLQLGFGRGVSPLEMEMFDVRSEDSQARYLEAYQVIMQALTQRTISHDGRFYKFRDVPMPIGPYQNPLPPLWYGAALPSAATWAAQNGINCISLLPPAGAAEVLRTYRATWAEAGKDPGDIPFHGIGRFVVVADTDEQALAIARRAYRVWHTNFWYLWVHNNPRNFQPPHNAYPETFDKLMERGQGFAGSPQTVGAQLGAQLELTGANYALLDFAFGDLKLEESMRSVNLFSQHIRPTLDLATA